MELKPTLQDYTREEFSTLVHTIWNADLQQSEHDRLVAHFDKIVDHPHGADLIYYPMQDFMPYKADNVVYLLKHWRLNNGKPGFKGASALAPAPAPRPQAKPSPYTKESNSAAVLAKISESESEVSLAQQAVEQAFQITAERLASIERQQQAGELSMQEQADDKQLATLIDDILLVQAAEIPIRRARFQLNRSGIFLKSDVSAARRNVTNTSPYNDPAVHEAVLQRVTHLNNQFNTLRSRFDQRYSALKDRIAAIMPWAQEQRVRLTALQRQGPNDIPTTFTTSLMNASNRPLFLAPTSGEMALFELDNESLHLAIQSAVARFSWEASSRGSGGAGHYSDLWQFSNRLGFDERYGFSLPLSEIIPSNSHDWQNVSMEGSSVELPVRMGSNVKILGKEQYEYKHIFLTPTDGLICPKNVRVRTAVLNQEKSVYHFTSDGAAPTTVVWTLPPTLDRVSDALPANIDTSNHPGISRTLSLPTLLPLPTDVEFDDYVIVFPEESDIAPLYLMLKDRRHYAGVTEGQGVDISGEWLSGESTAEAKVPSRIAEQLRGRVFKQFDDLKIVFWKAIAADPAISMQFAPEEIAVMLNGAAPSVTHEGLRKTYYLSHISPAAQGGKVYDFDNMRVMLPG
jgi:hypothetical protein